MGDKGCGLGMTIPESLDCCMSPINGIMAVKGDFLSHSPSNETTLAEGSDRIGSRANPKEYESACFPIKP